MEKSDINTQNTRKPGPAEIEKYHVEINENARKSSP